MEKNKEQQVEFKKGDRIDIGTGFSCDKGTFLRYEGKYVVWRSFCGGVYKTPPDEYHITKIKTNG